MTLKTKTSSLLALLVSLSVGGAGLFFAGYMQQVLQESISAGLDGVSAAVTTSVRRYLDDALEDAAALARHLPREDLKNGDWEEIDRHLQEHAGLFPQFHNGVFLLGPEGHLLVDAPPHPEVRGRSFAFREYYRQTLERGQAVVGQPYLSARTGQPVLTFTQPIYDDDGRLLAILGCSAHLLAEDGLGAVVRTSIGTGGYLYVYDSSRLMILHPSPNRVMQRDVPLGANRLFDLAISEGFEGIGETVNSRGVPMLLSLKQIPGTDWIMGVQQPLAEAFAPLRQVRSRILSATVIAVGISVLAGILAVGRITAPLQRLRDAALRLEDLLNRQEQEGSSDTLATLIGQLPRGEGGDEIDDLSQAFAEAAGKLKTTVRSLRGSLVEWARTFDSVPNVVCILDRDGVLQRLNRAAAELFAAQGVPPREGIGIDALVGAENAPHTRQCIDSALQSEVPGHWEWIHTPSGRHFSSTVAPLLGDGGAPEGVIFIAQDVTARNQAESSLRESERRFRELAKLLPELVFETDTEGTLRFVNEHAHSMTGYSANELLDGLSLPELVAPRDRLRAEAELSHVMRNGGAGGREYTFQRKDGGTFTGLARFASWSRDDGASGCRGIVIDVTHRKQLESQLRQAGKMEAIGQLAGGIAHDFNNLLTPILGYTEMVAEDLPSDHEVQEMLDHVMLAALRARELVNQVLLFSRQSEEENQALAVVPVFREAMKLLRASLPSTIELRSSIGPDLGATLASPAQLHQILINLGSNAAQAIGSATGTIRISADREQVEDQALLDHLGLSAGEYIVLHVRDNGPGIAPEYLDRIFDPFFTTKEVGGGSGLGLSVVHGIAARLGGTVQVETELGRGTSFSVYLPSVEAPLEDGPAAVDREPGPGGTERILLVDDEPVVLDFIRQVLERRGYEVVSTTSSVDAAERFKAAPRAFDLVITDQTMPEMTGITLVRELRRIAPEVPIILCTGYSQMLTPEILAAEGITRCLMKPVSVRDLSRSVREALQPSKAAEPNPSLISLAESCPSQRS